jgi:hypothetical protein
MVFRADTDQARTALTQMDQALGTINTQTGQSTATAKAHSTALEKEAASAREAAAATLKLSEAERQAQEEAKRRSGIPARPVPANQPTGATPHFGPEIPKQIEDMRAKYVPLFAAQRTYQAELKQINAAHKSGAISAKEHAAAMAHLEAGYRKQVAQIGALNPVLGANRNHMKLNAHQAQNLSYQINDVVQTLALGMPLQQILMQQGPQITQIYGGVGNTFRALKSALTAGRLAIGGVSAAVVVGASAWNGYLKSTKDVATAATGIGRAVAGTSEEMEAAARAGAAAAGINIKAARSMEAQFLRTGRIGSESFEGLIGLSKDFAATLGIDAKEIGGTLADMFADPAEAADTLLNKYGLIDAATARNARMLAAQNRESEARAVLIEGLPDRLAKAEEAVTGLAGAWNAVKTGASNALDATGQFIDAVADGEAAVDPQILIRGQLAAVRRARQKVEDGQGDGLLGRIRGFVSHAGDADQVEIELDRMLDERRREAALIMRRSERERGEKFGSRAIGIADQSSAIADAIRREALQNDIAALRTGQNAPGLDDTQRERIAQVIEARSNALDGLINKQARLLQLDRLDVQIQTERNPLLRADLEARRTRLDLADQEMTSDKVAAEAARARARVLLEATSAAQTQARDMRAEIEIRGRLSALVASGALTSEQANRQLQEELQLRPLITAAAMAEGAEKAELQKVIEQLRDGYADLEKQRSQASGAEFLRGQQETLEKLRVEASLLGVNAEMRAKILGLLEAEREIRARGIDPVSQIAGNIRGTAQVIAAETLELERWTEAWDKVGNSAESAIDKVTDSLAKGDISGALEGLAAEITGLFTELTIKNPLKNAILGTNYGTMDEVGGLGGIWDRLTGKATAPQASSILKSQIMSTGAMTVTAGTVTVNGGLGFAAGAAGQAGGAANINGVAAAGGLTGQQDVQNQVWRFFAAKGLKPHQIAGIMGNVSAESGFNPLAQGDVINGKPTSFGLFQHHKNRATGLLNQVGGRGNLGDVQGQLEYVWKELQSSEGAAMRRLLASTNVREATGAFVGFERPQGWSAQNPEGALHFDRRLGAAQAAMTKFSTATDAATQNLGTLGQGADIVGTILSNITGIGGGQSGGGGSLWGTLIGGIAGAVGLPGFRVGGATGGSDPSRVAGVVHEQEFVFDADATRRIGAANLEAIRKGSMPGYRKGGLVSSNPAPASGFAPQVANQAAPVVMINNYTGEPVTQEETVGPGGQKRPVISIGEQGAAAVAQRGNPLSRQLEGQYGLKRKGPAR